ncbi:MAG: UDP-N-acetylglucosamine--N-acetylmuramyl-(pentapeptide) pyrophosphoryl-undecaprenol N-acetylglucosamine transferase, partial [Gemmatimonadaceae bacterium]
RRQWWKNLRWPAVWPALVRRIDVMLDEVGPDAAIGTGGYASGPVLWRATRRCIPTGILELDVRPGIATRLLAGRVNEVWLAAPEARAALPRARHVAVTGAPIAPPDPARRDLAIQRFGLAPDRPVVVITGGSQGARAINQVVAQWLAGGGGRNAQLIWATGRGTYEEFAPWHDPPRVQVSPFIDPMADAWAVATVCVARAGMMTLAELCAWGIPSILVPLPTAAADHQTLNARALAAAGAAVMLPQAALDAAALDRTLGEMIEDSTRRSLMAAAARDRGKPAAAATIAERIEMLVASR